MPCPITSVFGSLGASPSAVPATPLISQTPLTLPKSATPPRIHNLTPWDLGIVGDVFIRPIQALKRCAQLGEGMTIRLGSFWKHVPRTWLKRPAPDVVLVVNDSATIRNILEDAESFQKPDAMMFEPLRALIGDSVLTTDGEEWRQRRRAAGALFTPNKILSYGAAIRDESTKSLSAWQTMGTVDLAKECQRVTAKIITRLLFGNDLSATDHESVINAMTVVQRHLPVMTLDPTDTVRKIRSIIESLWTSLKSGRWIKPRDELREAISDLDRIVEKLLSERLQTPEAPGVASEDADLLSHFIKIKNKNEGGISPEYVHELRNEALTYLLAGYETTTWMIGWTLYHLAKNPAEWAALANEVRAANAAFPNAPDTALQHMPKVFQALWEASRINPSIVATGRKTMRPISWGGRDFPIGTTVILSLLNANLDPKIWNDPEAFRPERHKVVFAPKLPLGISEGAGILAFGAGPHSCIGRSLALYESAIFLSALAARADISPLSDRPPTIPMGMTHAFSNWDLRVDPVK